VKQGRKGEMQMTLPKTCRVVVVIDKLDAFTKEAGNVLGLRFVRPQLDEQFTAFSVEFGEHGRIPLMICTAGDKSIANARKSVGISVKYFAGLGAGVSDKLGYSMQARAQRSFDRPLDVRLPRPRRC
jgi:hypothetical protein